MEKHAEGKVSSTFARNEK